ncbi:hypothetical protein ACFVU2_09865 [Leifsonia sp. NPDC058194]|uniref:hypothetical protein n=1 Tax=Leifsonia sp. NPDC058194 TaxID=3346374 RepID=UPI0036D9C882
MTIGNVIMLVMGFAGIVGGLAAVAYRVPLADRNRRNIEARFGAGQAGSRRSTPGMMLALGLGWAAIGLGVVISAIIA